MEADLRTEEFHLKFSCKGIFCFVSTAEFLRESFRLKIYSCMYVSFLYSRPYGAFVLSLKPSLFTEFMSIPSSSHFLVLCSIISRAVFPRLFFVSIRAPKRSKFLLASSLLTSNKFGSSSQFDDSSQWRTESNWK